MAEFPVIGVVDSGSDITIVNGELLKKVAAVTKLRKKDLKKPDKKLCFTWKVGWIWNFPLRVTQ